MTKSCGGLSLHLADCELIAFSTLSNMQNCAWKWEQSAALDVELHTVGPKTILLGICWFDLLVILLNLRKYFYEEQVQRMELGSLESHSVKYLAESKSPLLSLQHLQHLQLCFSCWLDKHTLQFSKYLSCRDHSGAWTMRPSPSMTFCLNPGWVEVDLAKYSLGCFHPVWLRKTVEMG